MIRDHGPDNHAGSKIHTKNIRSKGIKTPCTTTTMVIEYRIMTCIKFGESEFIYEFFVLFTS
jgi:hypothetical protein